MFLIFLVKNKTSQFVYDAFRPSQDSCVMSSLFDFLENEINKEKNIFRP